MFSYRFTVFDPRKTILFLGNRLIGESRIFYNVTILIQFLHVFGPGITRTVRSGVIQGRSRVASAIENFSCNEPRVKDVLFRVLKQMRDENERSKANLQV